MDAFRKGQKDVLVATDVASKGLDFADVQHVINYDMPDDVENYGEFGMRIVWGLLVGFKRMQKLSQSFVHMIRMGAFMILRWHCVVRCVSVCVCVA